MSRIGKKPAKNSHGREGLRRRRQRPRRRSKGKLRQQLRPEVTVTVDGGNVVVARTSEDRQGRAMHGLYRALIVNMLKGVSEGYEKKLEIVGVGYLAAVAGKTLQVRAGYANEIQMPIPEGLKVTCPDQTHVIIQGVDKQLVGQFAAEVRAIRKPEPYKGKGIRYDGEVVVARRVKPSRSMRRPPITQHNTNEHRQTVRRIAAMSRQKLLNSQRIRRRFRVRNHVKRVSTRPAAQRVPQPREHLRADHRRRVGQDACLGLVDGERLQVADEVRRQQRRGETRRQNDRRAGRGRRHQGSPRSTAVITSFTSRGGRGRRGPRRRPQLLKPNTQEPHDPSGVLVKCLTVKAEGPAATARTNEAKKSRAT
jgi:large subunit ribosomal protein L6